MEKIVLSLLLLITAGIPVQTEEGQDYTFTVFLEENISSEVPDYQILPDKNPDMNIQLVYQFELPEPYYWDDDSTAFISAVKDYSVITVTDKTQTVRGSQDFTAGYFEADRLDYQLNLEDSGYRISTLLDITSYYRLFRFGSFFDVTPSFTLSQEYFFFHNISRINLVSQTGLEGHQGLFDWFVTASVNAEALFPVIFPYLNASFGYNRLFQAGGEWQFEYEKQLLGLTYQIRLPVFRMSGDFTAETDFSSTPVISFKTDIRLNVLDRLQIRLYRYHDKLYNPIFQEALNVINPEMDRTICDIYSFQIEWVMETFQIQWNNYAYFGDYLFDFTPGQSFIWLKPDLYHEIQAAVLFKNGTLKMNLVYELLSLENHRLKTGVGYEELRFGIVDLSFNQNLVFERNFNVFQSFSVLTAGFKVYRNLRYFIKNGYRMTFLLDDPSIPIQPEYQVQTGFRSVW